ncbi:PREDICTED: protein FATTY ACID EXPORT 2, chloroplastic-like [Nelumbo nucifera]|uniref:Protein FATTY ACID EXPORT 2, chloroplastic-like n=2 Tax=Nelumbo nucifera TaxID=4432 RepID=A0A1U7Z5H1_NELNU|nr:PREDICTED: protein FATTY ACID EXPORT 2, chloroplastic-like [Nelumbo nucifera]DAD46392.1 TPA_asm: hypothetical protein HUJ06_016329 [Nelumbo nucifera]
MSFTVSTQSSLLPLLSSSFDSAQAQRRKGIRSASLHSLSSICINNGSLSFHRTTYFDWKCHRSRGIVRLVAGSGATPLIVESSKKQTELPLDTSGGEGFGGNSGGGGGGGGGDDGNNNHREGNNNNNNDGEGGSNKDDSKKKMAFLMSQKLTLGYAALIGAGGVMGYLKSGSQKSLAAGGLSALLLYYVYTELPVRPVFASSLGLGVSAVLSGVMGSRFKKSGKIFPAGVVSFVSLIMTGGYLHGIMRTMHG